MPEMDSRKISIIILSGGKGTRSENPNVPKILQSLQPDLMVLDTINESVKGLAYDDIVFALGDVVGDQEKEISKRTWGKTPQFVYSKGGGTALAAKQASALSDSECLAIIMGDSAMCFPLADFAERFINSGKQVGIVCRFSEHPIDSDGFTISKGDSSHNFIRKGFAETSRAQSPIYSVTGILFAKTSFIRNLRGQGDLIHEVISTLKEQVNLPHLMISRFYSRDTGTKERIDAARSSFADGSSKRRGGKHVGAIFLDRDGTLIPNKGDARTSVDRSEIPEDLAQAIGEANKSGVPVFLVSNQPGIAKGKILFSDVERVFSQIQSRLMESGAFFDDFHYCPHHPETGHDGEIESLKISCSCRKPAPGMFLEISDLHYVSLAKSFLIGDSRADKNAASQCGMRFAQVTEDALDETARQIRKALEDLTK